VLPQVVVDAGRRWELLFVGDDWAEEHHDVELVDHTGRRLAKARLPEGIAGITRLHELLAAHLAEDAEPGQVVVGIETDRGPWVGALVASGYQVYAINPMQAARYRERHGTSGAKSDPGDAHVLAELVRLDRAGHRPIAGDSDLAEAIKLAARAHQTLIWDRHRHLLRLRGALREFFPAALDAFEDLTAPDTLELLGAAPDPVTAASLSRARIRGALTRARRRNPAQRAVQVQAALRAEQLGQPPVVTGAYATIVRSLTAVITALNTQIKAMEAQVVEHFGRHPDAERYHSQPGLGEVLAARVLAEFGDDPTRYAGARSRKNYAGTSPITKASGKRRVVLARYARNHRLADALHQQAFCALTASPGARAYYDTLRARGIGHHAALRQLANRLVGILHGCLKTSTTYNEQTAWDPNLTQQQAAA
jgi:Transposase/Transposase IS116/IS110/IS902 family